MDYNRIIPGITTRPWPEWRRQMSRPDMVYEVGDLPAVADSKVEWPSQGARNSLYAGTDFNFSRKHYGYGSSVYVPDLGAHGTFVFGGTGEAVFDDQLTAFTLSDAQPTWQMFQQPGYQVGNGAAVAADADVYYSPTDYAALDGEHRIARGSLPGLTEDQFATSWDRRFPVGYSNFVFRRKVQVSMLGHQRWHSFRYQMPRYIPPSMTDNGHGAIVIVTRGPIHGPFSQGSLPLGITASEWFDQVWPSGRRKHFVHAMDVLTKRWQRLAHPIPDWTGYSGDVAQPHSCCDVANRRVYYTTHNGGRLALYYADFSRGLAKMSVVGPDDLNDLAGQPGVSQAGTSVLTAGHPQGRRLWYLRDATGALLLIDIDRNTLHSLAIADLPPNDEWCGFGYDAARNRVLLTTKGKFGVRSYRFSVPNDPGSAANYSIERVQLTFAPGVSLERQAEATWQYGERNDYLRTLGVILITQNHGRMLAYRPA